MVVLPRHRRYRHRSNNPYHGEGIPPSPHGYPQNNNNGGNPQPHGTSYNSGRSGQFMLLLAGMGIGYLVLPVLVVNQNGGGYQNNVGFNEVVRSLELQRAAAARDSINVGRAASSQFDSINANIDLETSVNSPMNMMQSHRATAAMLRGDTAGDVATAQHEAENGSGEEVLDNEAFEREPEVVDVPERQALESQPIAVNSGKFSNKNAEEEEEIMSEAQKRFVETQKLIASQSIPTSTNPHVMKTPSLPDGKRKKILVTGGAGFVGSHLVDKLMMEGHEVIVIDNFFTGQRKNIEHWMHHPRFSLVVHDVTEPIMLEVDEIYHLACPASPPHYQYNPVKTIKTSTMGTINMLGLAKRVKAKILLTSTSEIYGDPKVHPQPESYWGNVNTIGPRSCYDEGKRVAETMMYSYRNQNNVDVRVARIFNTFGPRMHPNDGRVVSNFIIQSLQDKPLTIYGDGSQTRSFQYVSDLVDGLHALMNGGYDLPVNLGNPDEYTVKHFAEYIKEITGSASDISFLKATQDDPTQRKPDITTAKRELNWEPKVTVKEGLQKTIQYFSRVLDESGEIIPTGPDAVKPKPKDC
eukprot:g12608.t1 g12608   contig6:2262849-2264896(+)